MNLANISENERIILDTVRRQEPVLRSVIHTQTPFTQPSVHRILENLIGKRLLQIGQTRSNGPGKPSPEILINRKGKFSLGISVNTDEITICLANLACESIQERSFQGQSSDPKEAVAHVKALSIEMLQQENAKLEDLAGVCLALSGFFTLQPFHMNCPEPLKKWSLINLHELLEDYFDTPIWIENNATTGAIGESLSGVGRWTRNFAYLSFNYGFGGGIIIDGKPHLGASGNALEISGIYDEEENEKRPALSFLVQTLKENGIHLSGVGELRSKFDPNWPGIKEWVDETMPMLNKALWAIKCVLDPEVIVLGGEIPKALAEIFIEKANLHPMQKHRYNVAIPAPKLIYTEASNMGAALGAALKPLKAQFFL